jgi:PilZ domain
MPGKPTDFPGEPSKATGEFSSGKRRYPRIALPKGMWVAWYGGNDHQISRVGTLGMGGIFICVATPPAVGTTLKLAFEVPGGEVKAEGIVRNIVPGSGMGIEFATLGPKDRVLLQRLLKRLPR